MLKLLLACGLDPDERVRVSGSDEVEYTWGIPLYHCAGADRMAMAKLLLDAGADPNAQIVASGTPVGYAYGVRNEPMVNLPKSFGGVVYAANAGYYRDVALARELLAKDAQGALPEGVVPLNETVAEALLESAASGGDPEILQMALALIDWPPDDVRWYWRLWDTLCFWNHRPGIPTADPTLDRSTYLTCFRLLLERSQPHLRPARFGQTILHEIAAMGWYIEDDQVIVFADAALAAGAPLDVRDDLLESTPLGWACRWGRLKLVRLLLAHGAPATEADSMAWTQPAAWVERMGHAEIVQELTLT